jgi:ferric-dicitrate binding protein FerR (iron transport regulator)
MPNPSGKEIFIELLKKYRQQQANLREIEFLETYYRYFDQEERASLNLTPAERDLLEKKMFRNIQQIIANRERAGGGSRKPVFSLLKWAAAASVIVLLSGSLLHVRHRQAGIPDTIVRYKNDLSPGGNRAMLILADGSRIELDSLQNGKVGNQGNARILKFNNALTYQAQGNAVREDPESIRYNTVSTPRGGQYQLVLADGSRVWLNAASSLRFPVAFTGSLREVYLTGEAYFEIAPQFRNAAGSRSAQERVPFYVHVNNTEVQVLGTHFNINAYNDEASVKTTLLKGAVKVVSGKDSVFLNPGNQSEVYPNGLIKFIAESDVENAVAWKNGLFEFRSADMETIMRQVARWYDVDVQYRKKIEERFYAEIPRNTPASDLFRILEATGAVHFGIEGRKVTVLP